MKYWFLPLFPIGVVSIMVSFHLQNLLIFMMGFNCIFGGAIFWLGRNDEGPHHPGYTHLR